MLASAAQAGNGRCKSKVPFSGKPNVVNQHDSGNACEAAVCNAGCEANLDADASRATMHHGLPASLAISVFRMAVILSQRHH